MERKPYLEEHERIQLRSDEVQDILSTPPSYFVRLGTVVICVILAALVALAFKIRYPDVIEARLILTTENPPVKVVAQTTGSIEELMVENGQEVDVHQPLAIIESAADYEDILVAESYVLAFAENPDTSIAALPENLSLGEVQFAYAQFLSSFKESLFQENTTLNDNQIRQLRLKRQSLNSALEEIDQSMKATQISLQILDNEIETKKKLLAEGLISMDEYRSFIKQRPKFIDDINRYKVQKKTTAAALADINAQILGIQENKSTQQMTKKAISQSGLVSLQGAIEAYKEKYIVRAPVAGFISFRTDRLENQVVQEGEEVLSLITETEQESDFVGMVMLPIDGSGKVEADQRVVIKFKGFPFQEYGSVEGIVTEKSLLPKKGSYLVKVHLPNGMQTSFGRPIPFSQEMEGTAEIITAEKSLIARILDNFLAVFRDYKKSS